MNSSPFILLTPLVNLIKQQNNKKIKKEKTSNEAHNDFNYGKLKIKNLKFKIIQRNLSGCPSDVR